MTAMTVLRDIEVSKIAFVGRPALRDADDASQPQPILLWKDEAGTPEQVAKAEADRLAARTPEQIKKDEGDALKSAMEMVAKFKNILSGKDKAELKALAGDEKPEEIKKEELPQAVREYMEKQEGEMVALRKESSEAVAVLKAEQLKTRTAEFVTKAEALSHIPGTGSTAEFAATLMKAADAAPEATEKLLQVLSGTEVLLSKSEIFQERGSAVPSYTTSGSAIEKVMAQAVEVKKAETSDKPISIEQAISRVFDDPANADLYTEYKRESQRAARER